MTGFASGSRPVRPQGLRALFELAVVRIGVATGAIQIAPVIYDSRFRPKVGRVFMAIGAGNRNVPTGERKMGFLMASQSECGRLVCFEVVASIASVEIRRCRKLAGVPVAVAIRATLELDLEEGVPAFRRMTLSALQACVRALQSIGTGGVFLHREG